MSLLSDILLGLFTPAGGGGTLTSPTLSVVDNGDGATATATVAGSDTGTTNTIYVAPWDSDGAYAFADDFTDEGDRSNDGDVTLTLAPGRYWAYCVSSLAGDYGMSNFVFFRVMDGDAAATTNLSLPRLRLMELVAACPTFQTVVGAAGATEAMASIHSPYADDHCDDDGNMLAPRPRAIINTGEFARNKLGTAYGGSTGGLILSFEFHPLSVGGVVETDPNIRLEHFEEQIGQILDEMEARVGQDKGAGEDVFTDMDTTHLNVTRLELVGGPAECLQEEERGELFMAAVFVVEYIG